MMKRFYCYKSSSAYQTDYTIVDGKTDNILGNCYVRKNARIFVNALNIRRIIKCQKKLHRK